MAAEDTDKNTSNVSRIDSALEMIASNVVGEYCALWNGAPVGTEYGCAICTTAVIRGLARCVDLVARYYGEKPDFLCCCHDQSSVSPKYSGEYMKLDFTLTTCYPNGLSGESNPYQHWPTKKCGIILAAQSEWGSPDEVLHDFYLLSDVRARLKVMVYARPNNQEHLMQIHAGFIQTLGNHFSPDRTEKWLFLGFPWDMKRLPIIAHFLAWSENQSDPHLDLHEINQPRVQPR